MTKIYLVRHGETSHNRDNNKLSGISDVQLTEQGVIQCTKLSKFFVRKSIDKVYSSPLSRAVKSTETIFPNLEKDGYVIEYGLIELNYGIYEGFDRAKDDGSDVIIQRWNTFPADLTFPNGDNVREHAEKAFNTLFSLAKMTSYENIVCVTHRTTIRLLVAKILDIDLNSFRRIPCSNCGITEIEYKNDKLSLVTLNATLDYTG